MQEESLQQPSFSMYETTVHQKTGLDLLRASIWDPFWLAKSIPKQSKGEPERHHVENLDFEGWGPAKVELVGTPNPGTHLYMYKYIYIYIYIHTCMYTCVFVCTHDSQCMHA